MNTQTHNKGINKKVTIALVVAFGLAFAVLGLKAAHAGDCGCTTTPTTPLLLGTCYPVDDNVNVGDQVTFISNAAGGTGSYTYSWAGDDGKTGSGKQINLSYSTPGEKVITVTITSGSQTINRACDVVVAQTVTPPAPITVSCAPNPSSTNVGGTISWNATASGGDHNYQYSWTGSNGLNGNMQNVSQVYNSAGIQNATVTVSDNGQTASATCSAQVNQVQNPSLTVSCNASPASVPVGSNVNWYATASGGNGNYQYSWTGSNGLYGNGQNVSQSYNSIGQQNATVTVSSNGQTQTAVCYAQVYQNQVNNPIYGSCVATPNYANVGQNITWIAQNVSGGNGSYSYSWTGSDGLYGNGQTASQTYNYAGTKTASLTIYSGGQSYTASCSANVNGGSYVNSNLTAYCVANPSNPAVNNQVTWTVYASGGTNNNNGYYTNNNYSYSWTGDNNLYGYGQTVYQTYSTPGVKNAYVTVTSNGQTITQSCSTNVIGPTGSVTLTQNPTGQLSSGVFLSQVPYTGAGLDFKTSMFILGLTLWSAFVAYMLLARRKAKMAFGGTAGSAITYVPADKGSKANTTSPINSGSQSLAARFKESMRNKGM